MTSSETILNRLCSPVFSINTITITATTTRTNTIATTRRKRKFSSSSSSLSTSLICLYLLCCFVAPELIISVNAESCRLVYEKSEPLPSQQQPAPAQQVAPPLVSSCELKTTKPFGNSLLDCGKGTDNPKNIDCGDFLNKRFQNQTGWCKFELKLDKLDLPTEFFKTVNCPSKNLEITHLAFEHIIFLNNSVDAGAFKRIIPQGKYYVREVTMHDFDVQSDDQAKLMAQILSQTTTRTSRVTIDKVSALNIKIPPNLIKSAEELIIKESNFMGIQTGAFKMKNVARFEFSNSRPADLWQTLSIDLSYECSVVPKAEVVLVGTLAGQSLSSNWMKLSSFCRPNDTMQLNVDMTSGYMAGIMRQNHWDQLFYDVSNNSQFRSKVFSFDPIACCHDDNHWLYTVTGLTMKAECDDINGKSVSDFLGNNTNLLKPACRDAQQTRTYTIIAVAVGGLAFLLVTFGIICWCCIMPARRQNHIMMNSTRGLSAAGQSKTSGMRSIHSGTTSSKKSKALSSQLGSKTSSHLKKPFGSNTHSSAFKFSSKQNSSMGKPASKVLSGAATKHSHPGSKIHSKVHSTSKTAAAAPSRISASSHSAVSAHSAGGSSGGATRSSGSKRTKLTDASKMSSAVSKRASSATSEASDKTKGTILKLPYSSTATSKGLPSNMSVPPSNSLSKSKKK